MGFFQDIFCGECRKQLQDAQDRLNATISDYAKLNEQVLNLQKANQSTEQDRARLLKELIDMQATQKDAVLEFFWNNKVWHSENFYFQARDQRYMDILQFFKQNNLSTPIVQGLTNDAKAINALTWVINNVKYVTDKSQYGAGDQWQWADETIQRKVGDCEDGAILLANIMVASGIPYWRVRLNAGDVKGGGHAWVTYLCEKDNVWYVLDWCYWPSESTQLKLPWSKAENYFAIWFSWNNKYAFNKDKLDRR
jgi:predicted transglutaminase-like cysteine proteinase